MHTGQSGRRSESWTACICVAGVHGGRTVTVVLPSQSFEPGETAGLSVGVSFYDAEETYYAKATIQV